MMHFAYTGSGPYCYANSFAMMFGAHAPSTAVIEFATGSPFGMQLIGGTLPFFDPYGWDPEAGFDGALAALGWTSTLSKGGDADDALSRLRAALKDGPVWIGPVEMGHLRHQPGMSGPIDADHYVVVIEMDEDSVLMHDPQGYPYARLPLANFMAAWRADTLSYGDAYTMRTDFVRVAEMSEIETIQASVPAAIHWLSMETERPVPARTLGNAEAAETLAARIETACDKGLRAHMIHFAVRVGARRAADAAACLARAGYHQAARIADDQARLIGALQHPLVARKDADAAASLRALAPTYDRLKVALEHGG
ncbi:hypothetical protein B0E45_05420 [Sinorhizobium sp. A49]|uniref:hypothetical protein n=1 Tax=Sinorhizobium sp. A49 TaxID=1945861 RepID=UPI0009867282|nr:hypothetical protein [Sinorhizobium sp. A49]OOG74414.1 hypothetical protein B0E45_05420 [Sinorhizobium sp. A49]